MIEDRKMPPDATIEPTREVLRRLWITGGSMSLRADDYVRPRALELAEQGWLVNTGDYPHFGSTYTQFKTGAKLDFKALRDL